MQPARRCATAEIDLEALAAAYVHRPASKAALSRPMKAAQGARLGPAAWVLDVGGGTGEHAAVFAGFGYRPVVIDPSVGMVGEAARRGLRCAAGRAEALPIADDSVALVYAHLSLHYGRWRAAVSEASRVLRPGGQYWIWTLGSDHHERSFLSRWFPSVSEIDLQRFPESAAIVAELKDSGFRVLEGIPDVERRVRSADDWIRAVQARFVSTLQLVDEEEIRNGIAAFRAEHPDPGEMISYAIRFTRIVAERLSLP